MLSGARLLNVMVGEDELLAEVGAKFKTMAEGLVVQPPALGANQE